MSSKLKETVKRFCPKAVLSVYHYLWCMLYAHKWNRINRRSVFLRMGGGGLELIL